MKILKKKYEPDIPSPFGYIYMLIDTVEYMPNSKKHMWYIGAHSKSYYSSAYKGRGSDSRFKNARKYRKDTLISFPIAWASSGDELAKLERELTIFYDVKNNKRFYNKYNGGAVQNELAKQKLKESWSNSKEQRIEQIKNLWKTDTYKENQRNSQIKTYSENTINTHPNRFAKLRNIKDLKISVKGVIYQNRKIASNLTGISEKVLDKRCNLDYYPDYFYLSN